MDTERYLKLAVLAAILIIALGHPVVAAFALTAVAAWHLEDFRISDMALVQKIVRLTPPAIKEMIVSRIASPVPSAKAAATLALPAPDPVRDAAPAVETKVREAVVNRR